MKDGNEGLAMLESGSLDAFASDKIKLIGLAAQAKDPKPLAILGDDLSIEPLAFALPRGDSAMRLEVNRALTQVYVGGEHRDDLQPVARARSAGRRGCSRRCTCSTPFRNSAQRSRAAWPMRV